MVGLNSNVSLVYLANYILVPPPYDNWPNLETASLENSLFAANMGPNPVPTLDESYPSFDVIGNMLDTPANLDWVSEVLWKANRLC